MAQNIINPSIGILVNAVAHTAKTCPNGFPEKIVIVDCGGTICCVEQEGKGLVPTPGYIENYVKNGPGTFNKCKPADPNSFNIFKDIKPYIEFASVYDEKDEPLDSSQMRPDIWNKMVSTIEQLISSGKYRGIVVTHGTDTLAFSASALTFAFPLLPIPIILTAAQFSLEEAYTDAVNNLFGSCMIALGGVIPNTPVAADSKPPRDIFYPEALVFFNNTLFLGTRIRKANATEMNAAFESSVGRLGVWTDRIHLNTTLQEKVLLARITNMLYWVVKKDRLSVYLHSPLASEDVKKECAGLSDYELKRSIENQLVTYCYLHHTPLYRASEKAISFLITLTKEFFRSGVFIGDIGLPIVVNPDSNTNKIFAMKLYPYMTGLLSKMLDTAYANGVRLFIVEAFGSGNGPDEVGEWFYLKNAATSRRDQKVYVAIVTQCFDGGFVSAKYAAGISRSASKDKTDTSTGLGANAAYVASCSDMSFECAVAKLWNLGVKAFENISIDANRTSQDLKIMSVSLRGELSNDDNWY
jgi:L-asparaginase/Glu-tRNA(Gln) amidotransferase subunit D